MLLLVLAPDVVLALERDEDAASDALPPAPPAPLVLD
jgi:hypothetical protein